MAANAASNSLGPATSNVFRSIFNAPAVLSIAARMAVFAGLAEFRRTAALAKFGKASFRSSSRFAESSGLKKVRPVMFPPGRDKLEIRSKSRMSPIAEITMGIVDVACFAASAPGTAWVTMTSTLRRTRSAANAGSRS